LLVGRAAVTEVASADEVVSFTAGDGRPGNVIHVVGPRAPTKGAVLLVHGAGVRANIFRAPVPTTVVGALLEAGHDVWLENWRASTDFPACQWTLDQAAAWDHPQAVRTVLEQTGADSLQAVVHCQGSTSFMMAAVAGLLPQVRTIVSNAVSLHPVVPPMARIKIEAFHRPVKCLTKYLDPQWGREAPDVIAGAIAQWVLLTHHECRNTVCRLSSFTYGVGKPTLWSHANLNGQTHEWLKGEFGPVPLTFFGQMSRCLGARQLVSVDGLPELPPRFACSAPETSARVVLIAGKDNRCFSAESQRRTFEYLQRYPATPSSLHVIPGYGHLDIFMGKNSHRDVFPLICSALAES
jgi:pimeloyl-ACP methyl ester carboxylesterase